MHKARLVWGVAASITFAWGALAGLEACSSDTTPTGATVTPPTPEAGPGRDSSPGITPTADAGPPADAGADCGTPAKLHPAKPDGGLFCPFSAPAGGKNVYCNSPAEQCCENPKGQGVSTCVAKGTACPVAAATVWECEDPSNCAAGQKCCAHSGDAGMVTIASDSCGAYLSKFSGTRCAATCGAGELVVCEDQSACTTGTCTAVKPKGNDIGVCK
jgi:hypothetical protein